MHPSLTLRWYERAGVEANGVRRATRIVQRGFVHPTPAAAPPVIDERLIIVDGHSVRLHAVRVERVARGGAVSTATAARPVVFDNARRSPYRTRLAPLTLTRGCALALALLPILGRRRRRRRRHGKTRVARLDSRSLRLPQTKFFIACDREGAQLYLTIVPHSTILR